MKQRPPKSYKFREIPHEGEIGAGRLLPFVAKGGTTTVIVPENMPDSELLGTMTVRGRSLEDEGIYDGDLLICKKVFSKKQICPDTICVVYIPATGEVVAKKIHFRENMLVLRGCGGGVSDMHVGINDVEIRGAVFSFQRLLNSQGRFQQIDDKGIPF